MMPSQQVDSLVHGDSVMTSDVGTGDSYHKD